MSEEVNDLILQLEEAAIYREQAENAYRSGAQCALVESRDAIRAYITRLTQERDAAREAHFDARFLLSRLAELEIPQELIRDWMGHVQPAIARLESALSSPLPR